VRFPLCCRPLCGYIGLVVFVAIVVTRGVTVPAVGAYGIAEIEVTAGGHLFLSLGFTTRTPDFRVLATLVVGGKFFIDELAFLTFKNVVRHSIPFLGGLLPSLMYGKPGKFPST